jgi:type II pantothenate kinase
MSIAPSTVGIDAGATLCKLVYQGETLETERYSSTELDRVRARIEEWTPRRILATGGAAERLGEAVAGVAVERVVEFEAWARGAPLLARRGGVRLPASYLLVSLGTGTSVLRVGEGEPSRIGGTALGGGTLVGLGRLLLGTKGFEEITALAARGDRRRVDLLVGDIYRHGGIPLPLDMNAASFGKLASTHPADLAHALMGLLAENVALICTGLARAAGIGSIVYCGSTLESNPALQQILAGTSGTFGCEAVLLPDGAYCGALGAAMSSDSLARVTAG